jgi:pSer/pThr/pTyr-binding forkhead associated (FHA) protein/Flp pilus assembly protein TadD
MKLILKPNSSGNVRQEVFDINDSKPRITVGRKDDNDFCIPAKNVSSYHAVIQYENGRVFVEDLNSTNGIFINNRKVKDRSELLHGDKLSFATIEFIVEFDLPSVSIDSNQEAEPDVESNGTVILDSTEVPDYANLQGTDMEPQVNLEQKQDDTEVPPPPHQEGRGTMLFGMKNVLELGRLVRIDSNFNPINEYNLEKPETTIGRENCDIIINHSSVSRFHALVKKTGGNRYQLVDNDSTNGVFVNGRKVSKHTLNHEDRVKIGDLEFIFLEPGKIFYKDRLKEGGESTQNNNKKYLIIGAGAVVVILLILALIPGGSDGSSRFKKEQLLTENEIVAQIQNSLENQSWDEVVDLITSFEVQGQDEALKKAQSEIKARNFYNQMKQALDNHKWNEAKQLLGQIDNTTTYYEKSAEKYNSFIENFFTEKEEEIGNLISEGEYSKAVSEAEAVAEAFPNNIQLQQFVADVKEKTSKLKRKANLRQAYRRKILRVKRSADKYMVEAKSNYLNGKIVEALTSLSNAKLVYEKANLKVPIKISRINTKMQSLRKHYFSGKKLMMQGNVDAASSDFEQVFALSKDMYGENGVIEKEIMSLMSDFYLKKGRQYFDSGNYVKAYKYIDKVLSVDPNNSIAKSLKKDISGKANKLYTNGYIEQTQYKDCKRALFYYKQVIELIPSSDPLYSKTLKRIKDCEK